MSFSNVHFILFKPQLSENIGACARAIKNFNFKKLILVNPKPVFPNDKIIATSVGAKEIVKSAKVYPKLEHAIKKETPPLPLSVPPFLWLLTKLLLPPYPIKTGQLVYNKIVIQWLQQKIPA